MFEAPTPVEEHRSQDEWRAYVANELLLGGQRMDAMQADIQTNTELTGTLNDGMSELLGILNAGKGGLKVLGWIGTVAKWLGGIAAAAVALYGLWQIMTGLPPK